MVVLNKATSATILLRASFMARGKPPQEGVRVKQRQDGRSD
jgi:hypothetical protein